MAIKDFLDKVVPKYSSPIKRGTVDIMEQDPRSSVNRLVWTGADFQHLDHSLAKDMTSFFRMANSPAVFHHDCDGVVLFESGNKKYMFLCELKSGFDTAKLYEAKTQIISSFLKTNMLLHLYTSYKLEDYDIKGFIVGRPPKSDFLVNLHQQSMLSEKPKEREYNLARKLFIRNPNHKIILKPTDFYCIKGLPLGNRGIFPKIELHFIGVSSPDSETTLDVSNYL